MRKIGILGGTFNPLHNGHLYMAYEAREALELDEVILMPNFIPPHKTADNRDPKDTLKMLERVFINRPGFLISTYELDKEGYSYTHETLAYFTETFPDDEFYFIIGEDSYVNFSTWKKPETILKLATLVVLERNTINREHEASSKEIISRNSDKIIFLPSLILEISSEEIRKRIRTHREIGHFVPREVERYIYERELYQKQAME